MGKLTEEQINKATEWWADRVCAPVFDGLSKEERKNPVNNAYQMAELMAFTLTEPVEDETRHKFIEALKEELGEVDFRGYYYLSVDYHPDRTLANAAEKSGVSLNNFPWKTHMSFHDDGSVSASCGYGASSDTL